MKKLWILLLALLPLFAFASKEGMLPLTSFNISSDGLGSSGPVVVQGNSDGHKVSELTIKAFDKIFKIPRKHADELGMISTNGVSFTYEAGRKIPGGRTLYITFSKSFFVSGERNRVTLIVTESGNIEVRNGK